MPPSAYRVIAWELSIVKFLDFSKLQIFGIFRIGNFLVFSKLKVIRIFQIGNFCDFPN